MKSKSKKWEFAPSGIFAWIENGGMLDASWLYTSLILIVAYFYIIYTDFTRFEITNRSNLVLLSAGVIAHLADGLMSILPDLLTGGLLFAFTFPFWLGRLIGAGDVKLLAVSGFIVGIDDVLELAVLTLGFSLVSIIVIGYGRYLLLLPAAFNRRLEIILKQGKIPYGVPVSLAAICIVGAKLGSAI